MRTWIAAAAACLVAGSACAGTVYKCTVGGKIAYGDQPCAGGAGKELAVQAAPPVDQAAAEKRASDRLRPLELERIRAAEALRREREQERERQRAAKAFNARQQKCAGLRLKQKWADEDLHRARGDAVAGARLKARRQAEALAVECPA